jgi:hypothetical protein
VAPGPRGHPPRRHHRHPAHPRPPPVRPDPDRAGGGRDPAAGVLQAALTGDIEGWARWTLTPRGTGTLVRYDQEVDVRKPLLRRFAVPGRVFFRANHTLMMRAGRRGLAAHLAAV